MTTNSLITKADRRRLGSLLTTREGRAWGTLQTVGELEGLLEDAAAVSTIDPCAANEPLQMFSWADLKNDFLSREADA